MIAHAPCVFLRGQIPYITSGRIDLRETDTETAFRIINFLDEQKGENNTDDRLCRIFHQHAIKPA